MTLSERNKILTTFRLTLLLKFQHFHWGTVNSDGAFIKSDGVAKCGIRPEKCVLGVRNVDVW